MFFSMMIHLIYIHSFFETHYSKIHNFLFVIFLLIQLNFYQLLLLAVIITTSMKYYLIYVEFLFLSLFLFLFLFLFFQLIIFLFFYFR